MINNYGDIAVIFDLDGVISDTQDLHATVDSKVLRQFGIYLQPDEITVRFAGMGDRQMFSILFKEYKIEGSVQQAIEMKWKRMANLLSQSNFQPVSYSVELIQMLHAAGISLSIGSGSPISFIMTVLDVFSLHKYFEHYVSAEEVPNPKPHPDIFLEASRRMGIKPHKCVVVEDGISGMEAAVNAGMGCIGLVKDPLRKYPANYVVTSLAEVTLELIGCVQDLRENLSYHATSSTLSNPKTACAV